MGSSALRNGLFVVLRLVIALRARSGLSNFGADDSADNFAKPQPRSYALTDELDLR